MIGSFEQDGKVFSIDIPNTPRHWTNKLFNDHYMLEIDERMQGSSKSFVGFNEKEHIRTQRHFYVRDKKNGQIYCPLYAPIKTKYDSFKSEYALGYHKITSEFEGLRSEIKAFVPVEGIKEIWTVKITNIGFEKRELSLFSVYSFEDLSFMGSYCDYDKDGKYIYKYSFPPHAKYEDKAKLDSELKYVYAYCDKEINSYETNKYRFYGCEDETEVPKEVLEGVLKNTKTQGMESILAGFENIISLNPGEEYIVNFILGATAHRNEIEDETKINVSEEFAKVQTMWEKRCSTFTADTGDAALDYLVNYHFKKQVTYLSRTNRFDVSSPVRNELQDSMGYAFCEPYEAFDIMKHVLKRQYYNGYIKQWNIHDGSGDRGLATLRHSDAPIWIIICMLETISYIINDASLYDEKLSYIDSETKESIREHIKKAAYFMSCDDELGEHGLCLMRDGDWTDPMNAPGRDNKGESVWNTMALIYAINEYNKLFFDEELAKRAEKLKENINKYAWDGEWYLAAIDDSGRKVGTHEDEEGKIFLNTQSWAVISQVCTGERLEKVKKSLESLKTKCGYRLSDPPFGKWNEKWGKISIKQQGALENGSVYCHGTLFKALGDYISGDYKAAMETIKLALPTNPENPNEINMQLPLYVPNYYFGIENENFGRSSCFYNTGTTTWILVLLNRMNLLIRKI